VQKLDLQVILNFIIFFSTRLKGESKLLWSSMQVCFFISELIMLL